MWVSKKSVLVMIKRHDGDRLQEVESATGMSQYALITCIERASHAAEKKSNG